MTLPLIVGPGEPALIEPNTGELVLLSEAQTGHIAEIRDHLKDLRSQIDEANRILDREVLGRMDHRCSWTLHEGNLTLTAPAEKTQDAWDGAGLHLTLEDLVAEGDIAPEAMHAAVEEIISYKVKAAGVKALLKTGGHIAACILEHRTEAPRDRRVTVKRAA